MTLIELKKSLHEKIDRWDDVDILAEMNTVINNKKIFFQIPQEQLEEIKKVENIKKRWLF